MDNYRVDQYGSVYLYDCNQNSYIFIGKLNGKTEVEFFDELFNDEEIDII